MIGCVGNVVGISVAGINVDVGRGVGEATVGMDGSVGRAAACLPQAARNARRTIQERIR